MLLFTSKNDVNHSNKDQGIHHPKQLLLQEVTSARHIRPTRIYVPNKMLHSHGYKRVDKKNMWTSLIT